METVSKDILFTLALELEPKDVLSLCLTARKFRIICDSRDFWRNKLIKDFKLNPYSVDIYDPKAVYETIYKNAKYCDEHYGLSSARDRNYKMINYIPPNLYPKHKIDENLYLRLIAKDKLDEIEEDVLFGILTQIKDYIWENKKFLKDRQLDEAEFFYGLFSGIIRKEIPVNVTMDDICGYNIY